MILLRCSTPISRPQFRAAPISRTVNRAALYFATPATGFLLYAVNARSTSSSSVIGSRHSTISHLAFTGSGHPAQKAISTFFVSIFFRQSVDLRLHYFIQKLKQLIFRKFFTHSNPYSLFPIFKAVNSDLSKIVHINQFKPINIKYENTNGQRTS